jgi:hypothetical protein
VDIKQQNALIPMSNTLSPNFKHETDGISCILSGMMQTSIVKTAFASLGVIGLSAGAAAMLFVSHAAVAGGPKMPEFVLRAPAAVAAPAVIESSAEAAVTPVSLRDSKTVEAFAAIDQRFGATDSQNDRGSVLSDRDTQDLTPATLAPFRALRPALRPELYEMATVDTTRDRSESLAYTRREAMKSAASAERPTVIRRVAQPASAQVRPYTQQSANNFDGAYLQGVFR